MSVEGGNEKRLSEARVSSEKNATQSKVKNMSKTPSESSENEKIPTGPKKSKKHGVKHAKSAGK